MTQEITMRKCNEFLHNRSELDNCEVSEKRCNLRDSQRKTLQEQIWKSTHKNQIRYSRVSRKNQFLVITALRTMQKVGNIRPMQTWNVKFPIAKRTLYSERNCDCQPDFGSPRIVLQNRTQKSNSF